MDRKQGKAQQVKGAILSEIQITCGPCLQLHVSGALWHLGDTEPKSTEIRSECVYYLGFYRSMSAGWMCLRVAVWEYLPVFPDIT